MTLKWFTVTLIVYGRKNLDLHQLRRAKDKCGSLPLSAKESIWSQGIAEYPAKSNAAKLLSEMAPQYAEANSSMKGILRSGYTQF